MLTDFITRYGLNKKYTQPISDRFCECYEVYYKYHKNIDEIFMDGDCTVFPDIAEWTPYSNKVKEDSIFYRIDQRPLEMVIFGRIISIQSIETAQVFPSKELLSHMESKYLFIIMISESREDQWIEIPEVFNMFDNVIKNEMDSQAKFNYHTQCVTGFPFQLPISCAIGHDNLNTILFDQNACTSFRKKGPDYYFHETESLDYERLKKNDHIMINASIIPTHQKVQEYQIESHTSMIVLAKRVTLIHKGY